MDQNPTRRAYLELHIAVLLFGFTAILGDWIDLASPVLVWWRVLITSLSLLFFIGVGKLFRELSRRVILRYMSIGILVALHWIAFYGAIKLANASIALVCLATTSFFTALIEPLIIRRKIILLEFLLGLLIIPGMLLVVRGVDSTMYLGFIVGLFSALFAALFSILNKKYIAEAGVLRITFLELGSAWLFISLLLPYIFWQWPEVTFWPSFKDWGNLLILALACTTLAYVLSLRALHQLSAFASTLTINLEPVYGILLAYWLLEDGQELNTSFYLGCLIILTAVLSYPLLRNRRVTG